MIEPSEELEACAVCGAILDEYGNCDNPDCATNADLDLEDDEDDEDNEIDWEEDEDAEES